MDVSEWVLSSEVAVTQAASTPSAPTEANDVDTASVTSDAKPLNEWDFWGVQSLLDESLINDQPELDCIDLEQTPKRTAQAMEDFDEVSARADLDTGIMITRKFSLSTVIEVVEETADQRVYSDHTPPTLETMREQQNEMFESQDANQFWYWNRPQDTNDYFRPAPEVWYADSTPKTLEAMIADQDHMWVSRGCAHACLEHTPCPTTFRILDLPRQLRDMIYKFALVADGALEYDIGECRRLTDYTGKCRYDEPDECLCPPGTDEDWCTCDTITPVPQPPPVSRQVGFLRVCCQINEEATLVYYSQPLKFSGHYGWLALYHWLVHISPTNRNFVTDITVEHPATATYLLDNTWMGGHAYPRHLTAFGFYGHLLEDFFDEKTSLWWHREERWGEDNQMANPGHILKEISGLRRLRLSYPNPMYTSYDDLARHPIHSYFSGKEGLALSMVKKRWPSREPESEDEAVFRGTLMSQGWKVVYEDVPEFRYEVNGEQGEVFD